MLCVTRRSPVLWVLKVNDAVGGIMQLVGSAMPVHLSYIGLQSTHQTSQWWPLHAYRMHLQATQGRKQAGRSKLASGANLASKASSAAWQTFLLDLVLAGVSIPQKRAVERVMTALSTTGTNQEEWAFRGSSDCSKAFLGFVK